MNKNIRAIILSFLLIAWLAISIGYVVSVQVDNEEFGISDSTETAQEWYERGISRGNSGKYKEAIEDYNKAIALDQNYAMAYYNRGNAYKGLKKYESAIDDYNKTIELDPNYADAYNNRGVAYNELKKYESAIDDYNKAIELDPNYAYAYNNRGVAYKELKKYERAIEDYNKAIELDPKYVKAYDNRRIAVTRLCQNISQNIMVESSLKVDNEEFGISDCTEIAQEWNEIGISRGNSGKYKEAIEDFNKAIALDPNYAEAYNNRGRAYSALKKYESAIDDYNKTIELDPNYADAYYNRGRAYSDLKEYERAIDDYNKAIDLNAHYVGIYYNRGRAYYYLEQYKRAIDDYNKAIAREYHEAFYYNRGRAYSELKKYERAIEEYAKAIEMDPNYADAYYNRGKAYSELKKYERAIDDYNKAIDLNAHYVGIYYNRGKAYSDLKEYERAIDDYNKAIELDPNYAEAYNNRGVAYARSGHYERAIDDYNKAIELDPNYAKAYNNRGVAYARSGHYERTMEDFEKVIELNQEPGIMENVVTDQSQNIMAEFSINYDINSNDSARTTIYIDLRNSEHTLMLKFLEFKIKDEHSNITNVEVKVPYKRTFSECNCSSSADWDNRSKNLTAYDFCYHVKEKNDVWHKYFFVAIYHILGPRKVAHYYVSYSNDDFIKSSEKDTKYLHVPFQSFRNVRVSKCVRVSEGKRFSWYNVPGSDNASLLEILNEDLNITWTENATISKHNNDTIIISSKDEQHTAKIIMGGNMLDAILEISDGNIRYLKIKKVYDKRYIYICDTQPTLLKTKDYNILINLPQDRYHYSKLLTVPHPHPDAIFMNEKSPALSWHFAPANRNSTLLLLPAYKLQKDYLMIALDTFVLLSIVLGFIGVILGVKDDKHKRRRLRIILVVIFVIVIGLYIGLTGLWAIYWELLLELFKSIKFISILG